MIWLLMHTYICTALNVSIHPSQSACKSPSLWCWARVSQHAAKSKGRETLLGWEVLKRISPFWVLNCWTWDGGFTFSCAGAVGITTPVWHALETCTGPPKHTWSSTKRASVEWDCVFVRLGYWNKVWREFWNKWATGRLGNIWMLNVCIQAGGDAGHTNWCIQMYDKRKCSTNWKTCCFTMNLSKMILETVPGLTNKRVKCFKVCPWYLCCE